MDTITRGNAAEAAVLERLIRLGSEVLVPFGEGHAYDLVADLRGSGFLRVQCKAARERSGCAVFNARSTDHGRGRLSYRGRADLFGVQFGATGSVYFVPVDECPGYEVNLRLGPTRNNQRRGVTFAADYSADRWDMQRLLAVARRSGNAAAGTAARTNRR